MFDWNLSCCRLFRLPWLTALAAMFVMQVGNVHAQTTTSPSLSGTWEHNGSRMKVEQSGMGEVFIYYEEPRAGLRESISPGTKLLEGRISGGRISGTAYVFKRGCPPAAYPVEGSADEETLTLNGPTPVWRGCQVVGHRPDGAHSRLQFSRKSTKAAQSDKPWAETASCSEQVPLIDRVLNSTRVEITSPRAGAATVGERVTVTWTTEGSQRPVPVYLVIAATAAVRVDPTEHAIVLLPKARFPFGLSVEEQSTRIVVPLYGGVPRTGKLSIELLTAGPQQVRAIGIGHAQPCRETRRVSRGELALDVQAGRPSVLALPDADISTEPKLILSSDGARLLRVHPTWFQLIEMPGETEIARIDGKEPRFSPTGRFVAFEATKIPPEYQGTPWSAFGYADAVDGKVLNHVSGHAILWDLQDSYLLTDRNLLGRFHGHSSVMSGYGPCISGGYQPLSEPGGGARFDLENSVFEVLDAIDGELKSYPAPLLRCTREIAGQDARLRALMANFEIATKAPVASYELDDGDALFNVVGGLREHEHVAGRVREPTMLSASDVRSVASQQRGRPGQKIVALARSANPTPQSAISQLSEVTGVDWGMGKTKSLSFNNPAELLAAISSRWPRVADRFSLTLGRPGVGEESCGIGEGIHYERAGDPIALGKNVVGAFEIGHGSGKELLIWKQCSGGDPETIELYNNFHLVGPGEVRSYGPVYGKNLFSSFDRDKSERLSPGDVGVWWFGDDLLLAANKVTRAVELIQWSAKRTVRSWPQWPGTARLAEVMIDPTGKLLLQIDADGSFFIHRVSDGTVRLRGRIVDDEIVVWTDDALYDASVEGAQLVNVRLPGRSGSYAFHQFERTLRVPGLARKVLGGERLPKPEVQTPPVLDGRLETAETGRIFGKAIVDAPNGVRAVHVYQDGVLTDRIEPIADPRNAPLDVERLPGARWATLLAIDGAGLASQPMGRDLGAPPSPSRISVVAIGVDTYTGAGLAPLHVAAADAGRLVDAVKTSASAAGRAVGKVKPLGNNLVTKSSVLSAVEDVTSSAEPGETLVLSFSGHGVRDDKGRFYLAMHDTVLTDLERTAISWSNLAESFRNFKGRVVVLLDACHSGMAGTQFFASNDDIAAQALAAMPSNVVLFAASKGREFSYESPSVGGGLFSLAVADVIAGQRSEHDLDKNGMIEISELLRGVKHKVIVDGRVVREAVATRENWTEAGTQTPWIARNLMVGDYSLF